MFILARVGKIKRAQDHFHQVRMLRGGNGGARGGGGGALIQGNSCEVFEVFAIKCGVSTCNRVELLAIFRSLAIA
ncbi:Cytoplasmic dynein 2 heavy chain 1 [Bienertia sinuspersici]